MSSAMTHLTGSAFQGSSHGQRTGVSAAARFQPAPRNPASDPVAAGPGDNS